MDLKYTNNEVADFLQNENLQSKRFTAAHSSHLRTNKHDSSGIKYGLSELSNDKTYLETELPARKRLKAGTELINSTKCLNKTCKLVVNDASDIVANEGNYSSEMSCILARDQGFENSPPSKELLRSNSNEEINAQNETPVLKSGSCNSVFQSNILNNQMKWDSKQLIRCNFERKSEIQDNELNSVNDLYENINDKISNRGNESETDFDEEVNKCYELLNLDVPRTEASVVGAKIANNNSGNKIIENNQIHKCEISNYNNKCLDSLYSQSTELVTNLKTMSNDINSETICYSKKLKMQDELLNKKVKNCEDNIEFKDESNSVLYTIVTSNSFLETSNENRNNFNYKLAHSEIIKSTEDNLPESEFKNKDNLNLKFNNVLNFNATTVKKSNIFIPETIKNHDSKNSTEHLDLTIQNTLNSELLKLKGTNQNISQDHSIGNKDDIDDASSTVDDSADVLSLYYESDFDFLETEEEIKETNLSESESATLEGTLENNANLEHNNNICNAGNESKNEGHFILSKNIYPIDASHTPDDKNCESHVLKGISNNDHGEDKNDFDLKVNESFVSEYEISLLAEDTDSILSEESLDSEYEISLLECDSDDEENKNDLHENKSDFNVSSSCFLHDDKKNDEVETIPQERIKEENEQTTNNFTLFEEETENDISENKIYLKSIHKGNITGSTEENILSICQMKVDGKTDSGAKKSAQETEIQSLSNIKSSECANVKPEPVTGDKIIQKLPSPEKYVKPGDIKKEPSENINDCHLPLKPEIYNNSQVQSEDILNGNTLKDPEEKASVVNDLADSAFTNKASIVKPVKTELDIPDIELKQNVTDGFQSSNKVVLDCKMDETKKSEGKVLIAASTFTDKTMDVKMVKSALGVSAGSKSKQDVKDIIPDYYEEEKEDLINPGWNKIKELSTDEERYQQVRDCWESKNIPDPFKNLTYYSYRKRKIVQTGVETRQSRQHKRHASSNLNDKNAKKSRSCTYIFDDRIKSINEEREMRGKTIHDKMFNEINRINQQQQKEEMGIMNFYGFGFDPRRQYELCNLRRDYEQRLSAVTAQYEQRVSNCYDEYSCEINKLKNNRNEVLQFYSFYKGLNADKHKDPTVLTSTQMQELEEIENIYKQMEIHYR